MLFMGNPFYLIRFVLFVQLRSIPCGFVTFVILLAGQAAVGDAVGAVSGRTQAAVPVGGVVAVAAGKPVDLAVVLEGQDVGGDPVEEPAVV